MIKAIFTFSSIVIFSAICAYPQPDTASLGKNVYGESVYTNKSGHVFVMADTGDGINIGLLKRHAEMGDDYAIRGLAMRYDTGRGVPLDKEEAKKYYLMSAEKGDAGAFLWLGRYYKQGTKQREQDFYESLNWFTKAAGKTVVAMIEISELYSEGCEDFKMDQDKANKWIGLAEEAALSSTNYFGAYYLGEVFFYGKKVAVDYEKAFQYLELAVDRGHQLAGLLLAEAHYKGSGTAVDLNSARKWLDKTVVDSSSGISVAELFAKRFPKSQEKEILDWYEKGKKGG